MNTTIMLFLLQDGITNGAIYALLGLALVLVFAVTRVILIPQGEFVAWGALHGLYLVIAHLWSAAGLKLSRLVGQTLAPYVGWALTLFAVEKILN